MLSSSCEVVWVTSEFLKMKAQHKQQIHKGYQNMILTMASTPRQTCIAQAHNTTNIHGFYLPFLLFFVLYLSQSNTYLSRNTWHKNHENRDGGSKGRPLEWRGVGKSSSLGGQQPGWQPPSRSKATRSNQKLILYFILQASFSINTSNSK